MFLFNYGNPYPQVIIISKDLRQLWFWHNLYIDEFPGNVINRNKKIKLLKNIVQILKATFTVLPSGSR